MNKKAMYKLSYGLFVLTAKEENKDNGCIINTAIQAASEPNQLSICINKANYTHNMIQRTGKFTVSVLSQEATFDLFQHFGFQSGRDVNKFESFETCARGNNGIFYITEGANAYISVEVTKTEDLGSHTMFIGKIMDMEVLSDIPSVTYEYYQEHIKPKPQAVGETQEGQTIWRCRICGYEYVGEELPEDFVCPLCKHPASDFEKVIEKKEEKKMAANKYEGTQTEKNLQEAFQAHHVDLTRVPLVPERREYLKLAKTEGEIEAVRRVVLRVLPHLHGLDLQKRVVKLLRPLLRCGKEHLADAAAVVFFQHAHDIEFRRIPPRFGKVKEADGVLAVERGEKRLLNTLFDVFLARLRNAKPVGQRF